MPTTLEPSKPIERHTHSQEALPTVNPPTLQHISQPPHKERLAAMAPMGAPPKGLKISSSCFTCTSFCHEGLASYGAPVFLGYCAKADFMVQGYHLCDEFEAHAKPTQASEQEPIEMEEEEEQYIKPMAFTLLERFANSFSSWSSHLSPDDVCSLLTKHFPNEAPVENLDEDLINTIAEEAKAKFCGIPSALTYLWASEQYSTRSLNSTNP
jgi:hypothetical protein